MTGPGTSRVCGRRGSTTTSAHPGGPRRSCAGSPPRLYSDHPADEPGNDDLGAISSWYVWAAIGLFPVTPGTADLALASPLFPRTVVTLPDNRTLTLAAPAASVSTPYIHSLTVAGRSSPSPRRPAPAGPPAPAPGGGGTWNRPWLPSSVMQTGGHPHLRPVGHARPIVGRGPGRQSSLVTPTGRLPAVGFSVPSGGTTAARGPGCHHRDRRQGDHGRGSAGALECGRRRRTDSVGR